MWQVRRALLELMRADTGTMVQIETRDDIVICTTSGEVLVSLQAKHSVDPGSLSPSSVEVWKSLRAWIDVGEPGRRDNAGCLAIVATQAVPASGLLGPFRGIPGTTPSPSACVGLRESLDRIAQAQPNQALKKAYAAWRSLALDKRELLLGKLRILDAQKQLSAIDGELQKCSSTHVRPEHLVAFTEQLIGWFEGRVAESLGTDGVTISKEQLREQVFLMMDSLSQTLTFDVFARAEHPEPAAEVESRPRYLRQLELLNAAESACGAALQTRFRAIAERDNHLQRSVRGRIDLDLFDQDLTDFWGPVFDAPRGESLEAQGWDVYRACMAYSPSIAATAAPRFLVCGTFHDLADRVDGIGWHPDYEALLEEEGDE